MFTIRPSTNTPATSAQMYSIIETQLVTAETKKTETQGPKASNKQNRKQTQKKHTTLSEKHSKTNKTTRTTIP
jgi:hypothetical protein